MRTIYKNAKFAVQYPGISVLLGLCAADAYVVAPVKARVKALRKKI